MKNLFSIIVIILVFGCKENEKTIVPEEINVTMFNNAVTNAINRDTIANIKLANLIDYSLPQPRNYNQINGWQTVINNKMYYFVVLENPNPVYNRFAVYDSILSPLLIDKSLNGNIFIDNIKAEGKDFIRIDESYLSKDTLVLNRLSLYSIDNSGISLSFRIHTRFTEPNIEYFQDIVEISDTLIRTRIRSSGKSSLNNSEDIFIFNQPIKKYLSSSNIFDNFIKMEIEDFNNSTEKQQLADTVITIE